MKQPTWNRTVAAFAGSSLLGILIYGIANIDRHIVNAQEEAGEKPLDLVTLKQEIELLKGKTPGQAHAMMDVDYHYTNLWFAAKAGNWALAEFYWKETISHMRWAVRIIPVRKDSSGREVKLTEVLKSIEQSPYMQVGEAIKAQDGDKFEAAYRYTLEGCYSCHAASGKPYLRPQIPERPATTIINFDPNAIWPR